ncbi:MAG: hypothetical protein ABI740_02225 [Alphaproteobacteria bacterium]
MSNSIGDVAAGPRDVTGVDRRTLDTIFRHPLSHNLAWREVVSLITTIGGVEDQKNGDVAFRAGGAHLSMTRPHDKDLAPDEVMDLRHFLTRAGWSPEGHREPVAQPVSPGIIIVIDHAGATLHAMGPVGSAQPVETHVARHIEREAPDRDRDEMFPEDLHFFETVARAVTAGGRIVVIGHGKGQSNEAEHVSAYLLAHHKDIHARIVREIVADLPHLTTRELLDLGRHALG